MATIPTLPTPPQGPPPSPPDADQPSVMPEDIYGSGGKDYYRTLAAHYAAKYGVDPDTFTKQIDVESKFNPKAVSPKGAAGLGQLMPATAQRYGVSNQGMAFNPHKNLDASARYMRDLLDKNNGDYESALSEYNSGRPDGWQHIAETRNYVKSIRGYTTDSLKPTVSPEDAWTAANPDKPLPSSPSPDQPTVTPEDANIAAPVDKGKLGEMDVNAGSLPSPISPSVQRTRYKLGGSTRIDVSDLLDQAQRGSMTPDEFKAQVQNRYATAGLGFSQPEVEAARTWGQAQQAGYDPFELDTNGADLLARATAAKGHLGVGLSPANIKILEGLRNSSLLDPNRAQAYGSVPTPQHGAGYRAGMDVASGATSVGADLSQTARNLWSVIALRNPEFARQIAANGNKLPYSQLAQSLTEQAGAEAAESPGAIHEIVRGVAGGLFKLPEYLAMAEGGPTAFAAEAALSQAHRGPTEAAKAGIMGALTGAAPEIAEGLPPAARIPLMAGIGGVPAGLESATQGATPSQAAIAAVPGAIQMGGLGAFGALKAKLGGEQPTDAWAQSAGGRAGAYEAAAQANGAAGRAEQIRQAGPVADLTQRTQPDQIGQTAKDFNDQHSYISLSNARSMATGIDSASDLAEHGMALTPAAEQLTRAALDAKIADPKVKKITIVAGAAGSGKSTYIESQDPDAHTGNAYYETHLEDPSYIRDAVDRAQTAGKKVDIVGMYRDPAEAYQSVVDRFKDQGKVVPAGYAAGLARQFTEQWQNLVSDLSGQKGVRIRAAENGRAVDPNRVPPPDVPQNLEAQHEQIVNDSPLSTADRNRFLGPGSVDRSNETVSGQGQGAQEPLQKGQEGAQSPAQEPEGVRIAASDTASQPQPSKPTGFTTAQGSTYKFTDGATERNKSLHPGHMPDDVGPKEKSAKTLFVAPEDARQVGMWQTLSNSGKRAVVDGDTVLLTSINPQTGKRGLDGQFKFTETPQIGQSPLELSAPSTDVAKLDGGTHEAYRGTHPGSPITDIANESESTAPAATGKPPTQGRSVQVVVDGNTRNVTLTPEQDVAFTDAERTYQQRLQSAAQWNGGNSGRAAQQRKAAGMQFAADKRRITGLLTSREQSAIARREATNYKGKQVELDQNGNVARGTVQSTTFGKVRVKLDSGDVISVAPSDLRAPSEQPSSTQTAAAESTHMADATPTEHADHQAIQAMFATGGAGRQVLSKVTEGTASEAEIKQFSRFAKARGLDPQAIQEFISKGRQAPGAVRDAAEGVQGSSGVTSQTESGGDPTAANRSDSRAGSNSTDSPINQPAGLPEPATRQPGDVSDADRTLNGQFHYNLHRSPGGNFYDHPAVKDALGLDQDASRTATHDAMRAVIAPEPAEGDRKSLTGSSPADVRNWVKEQNYPADLERTLLTRVDNAEAKAKFQVANGQTSETKSGDPQWIADRRARDYTNLMQGGANPSELINSLIVHGYDTYKRLGDYTKWAAEMVKEFGGSVADQLKPVWAAVRDGSGKLADKIDNVLAGSVPTDRPEGGFLGFGKGDDGKPIKLGIGNAADFDEQMGKVAADAKQADVKAQRSSRPSPVTNDYLRQLYEASKTGNQAEIDRVLGTRGKQAQTGPASPTYKPSDAYGYGEDTPQPPKQTAREFARSLKTPGGIAHAAVEGGGVLRSIKTAFIPDAMLRQGAIFLGKPIRSAQAAFNSFKAYTASPAKMEAIQDAIRGHPDFEFVRKNMGVEFTGLGMGLREESFPSRITENLPGIRHGSQAFSTFVNTQRLLVASDFKADLEARGNDPVKDSDAFTSAGRFVNTATGRGDTNYLKMNDAMNDVVNKTFFSPRLMQSRLDLMNPMFYKSLHPEARRLAAASMFKFAALAGSVMGLSKLAGAKVTGNPDDPDFGDVVFGNTHYDVSGGLAPYIRLAWKTGKAFEDGRVKDGADAFLHFARTHLAPAPAAVTNLYQGKTAATGELSDLKFDKDAFSHNELLRTITPMVADGLYRGWQDSGLAGAAKSSLSIVGQPTLTYPTHDPKSDTEAEIGRMSRDQRDGSYSPLQQASFKAKRDLDAALRSGGDSGSIMKQGLSDGTLTSKDIQQAITDAATTQSGESATRKQFKGLPLDQAMKAYGDASDEDKAKLRPLLIKKIAAHAQQFANMSQDQTADFSSPPQ